jgi:hypothetical protein
VELVDRDDVESSDKGIAIAGPRCVNLEVRHVCRVTSKSEIAVNYPLPECVDTVEHISVVYDGLVPDAFESSSRLHSVEASSKFLVECVGEYSEDPLYNVEHVLQ